MRFGERNNWEKKEKKALRSHNLPILNMYEYGHLIFLKYETKLNNYSHEVLMRNV